MWSCSQQQSNISACRENDICHVSAIFSSAFGKQIMYTHTCIHALTQGCFSYCLIPVTYHTLLGKSQHWRSNQLLSFRKHKMKWKRKQQKDCRESGVAHLTRLTIDKQHHMNSNPRYITEKWALILNYQIILNELRMDSPLFLSQLSFESSFFDSLTAFSFFIL